MTQLVRLTAYSLSWLTSLTAKRNQVLVLTQLSKQPSDSDTMKRTGQAIAFYPEGNTYKFLVQKRGPIVTYTNCLFVPGGRAGPTEPSRLACKRELWEETSIDVEPELLEFAGWIHPGDVKYPVRAFYMIELPNRISVQPQSGFKTEVAIAWGLVQGNKGHKWMTYHELTQAPEVWSRDMTRVMAVAYKWGIDHGRDFGIDSQHYDRWQERILAG